MQQTLAPRPSRSNEYPFEISDLPWLDRPDALDAIDRRKDLTLNERDQLVKWVNDGYIIIDNAVSPDDCDALVSELNDKIWFASNRNDKWVVSSLWRNDPSDLRSYRQSELLDIPENERIKMRDQSNWRVHRLMDHSQIARAVALNATINHYCDLIMGEPTTAKFSINFWNGSEQFIHQDLAVFHIHPPNFLIGVWMALEDIHPDSGPLVVYPGSHKVGMWDRFANYPSTNVRTGTKEEMDRYSEWLVQESERVGPRMHFTAKKGQVLLWHALVAHGGEKVRDRERTRKSYVLHYLPNTRQVDVSSQIEGPFLW